MQSFLLVEGDVDKDSFMISLMNAKQLVVGSVAGTETILHLSATTAKDLSNAIQKLAQVEGVKSITTLTLRDR